MKTAALVGSLAANVLFAVLLLRTWPADSRDRTAPIPPDAPTVVGRTPAANAPSTVTPVTPLAADDFAGLRGRLADAGIPAGIANFAVAYAIKQHFDQRRHELGLNAGGLLRLPITSATSESAEITATRARVDAEERAAMQAHGGELGKMSNDSRRWITGNLPDAKAHALLKIVADYREMEAQIPDRGSPAAQSKLALLEKERRADIERLLTPEELLEYDLRTSGIGGRIRNRVGAFPITEAEFRAVFAALKVAEAAANAAGIPARNRERDPLYEPEIRRALGESRYAELQATAAREEARVRAFTEAMSFIRGLNLPSTAANDLLVLQAEYRPRINALESARMATLAQREAQLSALAAEAQARFTHLLGENGFAEYRRRAGQWLDGSLTRIAP